jgi:DNA-directed RNA polymerase subunit RPC12/RpoP
MREPVRKILEYPFLQCPNCAYVTFSLSGEQVGKEIKYRCSACSQLFDWGEWKNVTGNVTALRCPRCGEYVADLSENWNVCNSGRELLCPHCSGGHHTLELVAIDGIHVSKFSRVVPSILSGSQRLNGEVYSRKVRNLRDRRVLRWLNVKA